jgi:hypothetical protein
MDAERTTEVAQAPHPLDPLLPQEIERSVKILKEGLARSNVDPDQLRFVRCSIVEPTKQQLASGEVSAENGCSGFWFDGKIFAIDCGAVEMVASAGKLRKYNGKMTGSGFVEISRDGNAFLCCLLVSDFAGLGRSPSTGRPF